MADDARRSDRGSPDGGREGLWAAVRPALDVHPIEPGALGEYALLLQERGPGPAERAFPDVAAHLREGCEQCAADLRDFPFELETGHALDGLRRLVATLLVPEGTARAAARGAGEPVVHSYRAGAISLSISILGGPRSYTLEGLVRAADDGPAALTGAPARLSQPGGAVYTTSIDELGNFGFDEVAGGVYELEVGLDDVAVVAELVVGDEGGGAR